MFCVLGALDVQPFRYPQKNEYIEGDYAFQ